MIQRATEQAQFWAGEGGEAYIARNSSADLEASNIVFFSKILKSIPGSPRKVLELGANIGLNFRALAPLIPDLHYTGVEVNPVAFEELAKLECVAIHSSIEDYQTTGDFDLVFSKGVLIHLNENSLFSTYQKMYSASNRWILVAEYYSPSPTSIPYRGREDLLFKRDFAGEMLDLFPDLALHAYGFSYHRGPYPQDDINWFLMRKDS